MGFSRIAVAVDFSPGADQAMRTALDLTRQNQASLLVVHVIPPLVTPSPLLDDFMVNQATMGLRENLRESCEAELAQRYVKPAAGMSIDSRILEGDPARELAALAKKEEIDLLVMGSTGLSGLAEVVFGSVAAKVVRRAPCSVLVVRASSEDTV